MVTRSDKNTAKSKQEIFYSDFPMNLDNHPNSGQLMRLTNEQAVKQSLRNLILTDRGERLYQPNVGGNVRASLFEPIDGFTANDLEDSIRTTIFNNEPRVDRVKISVVPVPDHNQYRVTIEFGIVNTRETTTFELTLTRTR